MSGLSFRGRGRTLATGFCDRFFDSRFDFNFPKIHDSRELGDQKESRPVEHALFAKRQWLYAAEMHKILENLGDMKYGPGAHSFGVFLESVFPVALSEEFVVAEVIEQLIDVFAIDDLPEADVSGIHCRNHHQDIVGTDSEEVEPFKLPLDQPIGNLLNNSNPMVWVDNLVANLKLIHIAVKKQQSL